MLHERVYLLTIEAAMKPTVANEQRVSLSEPEEGLARAPGRQIEI